jgi:triphosphoribosyl-dephospho-CoA synthase
MSARPQPRQAPPSPDRAPPPSLDAIGHAATLALHDELMLAPKPGLVSPRDSGSHDDMDVHTFGRSLFALRRSFPAFALLGAQRAPFAALQACGLEAEARMLTATGGINTHRGAIFQLGLLCAAAGALGTHGTTPPLARPLTPDAIRAALRQHWGADLQAKAARPRCDTPGGRALQRHAGLRGAAAEAAAGLPTLFDNVWPALREALAAGLDSRHARLHALMHGVAALDDTTLVHRGGLAGLHWAREQARAWLAAGGAFQPDALQRADALHRAFVARRLSPGGAADLLSAACWLQRVTGAAGPIAQRLSADRRRGSADAGTVRPVDPAAAAAAPAAPATATAVTAGAGPR